MIDDRFALSPVAARSAPLTEADYEAICAAFKETARGRWFLEEYARRNRHADTMQVLDAVARLEHLMEQRPAAPEVPTPSHLYARALRLVRLLESADQQSGARTLTDLAEALQHLAWNIREVGGDWTLAEAVDTMAGSAQETVAEIARGTQIADALALAKELAAACAGDEVAEASADAGAAPEPPPAAPRNIGLIANIDDLVWESPAESLHRAVAEATAGEIPAALTIIDPSAESLDWADQPTMPAPDATPAEAIARPVAAAPIAAPLDEAPAARAEDAPAAEAAPEPDAPAFEASLVSNPLILNPGVEDDLVFNGEPDTQGSQPEAMSPLDEGVPAFDEAAPSSLDEAAPSPFDEAAPSSLDEAAPSPFDEAAPRVEAAAALAEAPPVFAEASATDAAPAPLADAAPAAPLRSDPFAAIHALSAAERVALFS